MVFPLRRIHFLATVLAALPAVAQTTWHVDANAVAPGNGTPASPYTSIDFAHDQPSTLSGDTLLVAPGTYVDNLHIGKAVLVRSSAGPVETRLVPKIGDDTATLSNSNAVLEGFTICGTHSSMFIGVNLIGGTLRRCVVVGMSGGFLGLAVEVGDGTIDQCTILGNWTGVAGAHSGGTLTMRNTIVWGHLIEDYAGGNLVGSVDYCAGLDGDSGWLSAGTGNLPGDPLTHYVASGSPRLMPGSPCIDAGDPAAPLDPDGSRADVGAIPFDPAFVPGPIVYCTAKLNSDGCVPQIAASGQASLTVPGPFTISATGVVPGTVGLLFYGFGPRAVPFLGGTHCIQPPTPRVGFQPTGGSAPCSGTLSFDFNTWIQGSADPRFVGGAEIFGQYWYRDPNDPLGFQVGLTDAVRALIAP